MTNLTEQEASAVTLAPLRRAPAVLTGADLTGAYLGDCMLKGVNLSGANLSGVDLVESNLEGANLSGANLTGAVLRWASLEGADLTGANLTGADLSGTFLTGANLTGVVGISSSSEEIEECNRILEILESGEGTLNMGQWHTCDTVHCLAGWVAPKALYPAAIASRKIPSLAWIFYENQMTQEQVIEELRKVVDGTRNN